VARVSFVKSRDLTCVHDAVDSLGGSEAEPPINAMPCSNPNPVVRLLSSASLVRPANTGTATCPVGETENTGAGQAWQLVSTGVCRNQKGRRCSSMFGLCQALRTGLAYEESQGTEAKAQRGSSNGVSETGHVSEIDKAEQVPSDPVQTRYQLWLRHGFHLQEAGPSQSGGKSCCRQKGPLPGSQGRRLRGIDDSIGSRT